MTERLALLENDNEGLANLCGPLEQNLRCIETSLDIAIRRRGAIFEINGKAESVETARALLEQLAPAAKAPIPLKDVQLAIVEHRSPRLGAEEDASAFAASETSTPEPIDLRTRRRDLRGRTENQRAYLRAIQAHDISFGIGPAGTGKTFLAVASAVDALERDTVSRLILTRPAVEAGERLGFLPGDLSQKVDPYLRPLYDALYELMGL